MAETGRLTARQPRRLAEPGDAGARRDHRGRAGDVGGGRGVRAAVPRCRALAAGDRPRRRRAARRQDLLLASRRHRGRDRHRAADRRPVRASRSASLLGSNKLLSRAFEAYLYYLGPTPKIIFFPVMIMWFGVGPGSKVAMGTISCFFPVALSAAARHARDRSGADPRRPQLPRQHLADGDEDLSAGDAPADHQRRAARVSASRSSARCSPRPSSPTAASAS